MTLIIKTTRSLNCYLIFYFLSISSLSYAQSPFCIQTFNAFGPAYATDTQTRFALFLNELAKEKCDIIQLQEVWTQKQVEWVEDSLSFAYQFFSPNKQLRIGIMSLSNFDIKPIKVQQFNINNSGDITDNIREWAKIKKAFSVSKTKLPFTEEEIYVLNTHLHHQSTAVRLSQLVDIYQWRLKNRDLKIIMNGDFNANPNSIEIKFIQIILGMKDAFLTVNNSYPADFCTYCKSNPRALSNKDHIFDYIFYSNDSNSFKKSHLKPISITRNLTGKKRWSYSDHYGIRAHFLLDTQLPSKNIIPVKNQVFSLLMEVRTIFSKEENPEFKAYHNFIENMITQLY